MIEATADGYLIPSKKKPGTMRTVGALDVIRWSMRCGLPANVRRVLEALTINMDAPLFNGRANVMDQISRDAGYCKRYTRHSIRMACQLGVLVRRRQPFKANTYTLNVARIWELAERTTKLWRIKDQSLRTFAERAIEAAAVGIKPIGAPVLPGIAELVRSLMGQETAARLGWTQDRAWRLWAEVGRPSTESWGASWQSLISCELAELPQAPPWLWEGPLWTAKVAACRRHLKKKTRGATTPIRGAEWAFGKGSEVPVPSSHAWGQRISPQRALLLLQQTDAACCLPPAMSIPLGFTQRGVLRVHVEDARALAVADEVAATLLDLIPGPFLVTR